MKIAIVDDLFSDREKVTIYMQTYFSRNHIFESLEIFNFETGIDFLENFVQNRYHIIFIDYYMKPMSGMQLAKAIRKVDQTVLLIFTTLSRDFAVDSYKVKASGYLVKPFSYEDFSETLSLINIEEIRNKQFIQIKEGSRNIKIILKNIIYSDISGHYIQIYTSDIGMKRSRMVFEEWKRILEPYSNFLSCYRGCIINMEQVSKIEESNFLMTNGERIPIRRKEQEKILQIYADFLFEKVRNKTK